jgi:hypothetical protein
VYYFLRITIITVDTRALNQLTEAKSVYKMTQIDVLFMNKTIHFFFFLAPIQGQSGQVTGEVVYPEKIR